MKKDNSDIKINSTDFYDPEKVLTDLDLEKIVDTTDELIRIITAIKERGLANAEEASSDLATKAVAEALKKAYFNPKDIDLLLLATHFSDYYFPSNACIAQNRFCLKNAICFDLSLASINKALDEAITQGKSKKRYIVVLTALGAGLTWSAIILR